MEKLKIYIADIIKTLDEEYDLLSKDLSNENIIFRSIPIKVSKLLNSNDADDVNKILKNIFEPGLMAFSQLIDDGLIGRCINDEDVKEQTIDLFDNHDGKMLSRMMNKAMDKLFILKRLKYRLEIIFIQELYLSIEEEIKTYDKETKIYKLYNKIINYKADSKYLKWIITFRMVSNIYKHGEGSSLTWIKNNNAEILNRAKDIDFNFMFRTDIINYKNFKKLLMKSIEQIDYVLN